MFAKRQPAFAGSAAAARRLSVAVGKAPLLTKRQLMALAGAGGLFVAAAAGFIVLVGDPRGASPSVRVALTRPQPAGQRALAPDAGAQAFTVDSLGLNQDSNAPGAQGADDQPIQGEATITLPDSLDQPQSGAAGAHSGAPAAPPLPKRPPADPLPAAPIPIVSQATAMGPLPVIAPDGRTPAQLYARPFKPDGRPRVALVVGGLGLNPTSTRAAIEKLPAEVTLSFVPYAQGLQGWIDLARANGHEVLLEIPMEPQDYPDNDPGPQTLLADAPGSETVKRLDWLLSRASGYWGVSNYLGQKFVNSDNGMGAFTGELRQRGLAFVDDGMARKRSGNVPRASADSIVDDQLSADAIARQLTVLEQTAKARGSALGSGFAYPVTVDVAVRWAAGLSQRGLQLAPASALAKR
jgi:polysaccharide deacetylase 2 family uncharacterized protein YibQ